MWLLSRSFPFPYAERQRELKRMSDVIDGLIANKLRGVKRQKTTSDVGDEAPAVSRHALNNLTN